MRTKLVSVMILIAVLVAQGGPVPTGRARALTYAHPGWGSRMIASSVAPATTAPGPGIRARPADPRRFPPAPVTAEAEPLGQGGGLPVTFIPNQGQVDGRVRYYAQTGDHALWFTSGGVALDLPGVVLRLAFVDANPAPRVQANARQQGVASYFIGNDPSRWRTGLPTYGEVT